MPKIQVLPLLVCLLLAACDIFPVKPVASDGGRESGPESPSALSACPACPVCPAVPAAAAPSCPAPAPVIAPAPAAAFSRTLQLARWTDLPGWQEDDLAASWSAFLESCRGMASKPQGAAWKSVCDLARQDKSRSTPSVRAFFEQHLQPYAILNHEGQAQGMITGYYEPLLRGSRTPAGAAVHPILGVPDDLLTIDLGSLFPELKDKRVRGRIEGNKVVPYWSRADIQGRLNQWPSRPLAYVDDAVELFFLQVQGSGRVQLPNGQLLRLNYADQNGHPYQSIGRLLVERGELKLEEASMQGIQAWARANPSRLDELLNSNPSYVFFREVKNSNGGPQGALGVPLTAERSLAIDPRSIPLGAPVFLATTRPNSSQPLQRLMLAQDTGGAIKGAVRADFFWGFGKEAGEQAGRMKQSGRLWLLWPKGHAPK